MTLPSWLASLQALLPPGRALPREPGARFTKLLEAIAAMLLAAQLRFEALLIEWDPSRATTMLTDWERFLGLPDDCMAGLALTIPERQRIAAQRLTEQGGQSIPYFVDLAERLGEADTQIFDGFRPMNCNDNCQSRLYSKADRFVWIVVFNHGAVNLRPMNCNDTCVSALQIYQNSLAECPINERKPAHTNVVFYYPEISADFAARLRQFALVDTLPLEV